VLYEFESDWSNLYNLRPIFCETLSTLLHSVLASSFPLRQDFSKRASFPIVCMEWLYKKDVWGIVKSWEFEGNLRCSKILWICRKNPMKWVASISRDYWIYLNITCQSFKIWKFWGEFWGIETFHWSKFSPATGVTPVAGSIFGLLSQTHISKIEFKNGHVSRFCPVFQVIQVISSAKFFSAEEVDLSFN